MTAISAKRDQMRMIVGKIGMLMRDVGRIVVWPESPGQANTGKTDQRHRPKGRIHADPCAHLPGQQACDRANCAAKTAGRSSAWAERRSSRPEGVCAAE